MIYFKFLRVNLLYFLKHLNNLTKYKYVSNIYNKQNLFYNLKPHPRQTQL